MTVHLNGRGDSSSSISSTDSTLELAVRSPIESALFANNGVTIDSHIDSVSTCILNKASCQHSRRIALYKCGGVFCARARVYLISRHDDLIVSVGSNGSAEVTYPAGHID